MEKILKPYDKENMKLAMLKHEETFKHQVYELHRLYRVQKILMKGVENNKSKRLNQQSLNCSSEISLHQTNENPHNFHKKARPEINLDQPVAQYIKDLNRDEDPDIEDESEIQLTLGPKRYNLINTTETSESGTSFSSSSTGSNHVIKGSNQNLAWGLTMVTTDSNSDYPNTLKSSRLNQPSWHLQALSLNMS